MKPALIDTDILTLFFRNDPNVRDNFHDYLQKFGYINFSIITYYEILNCLKANDGRKQIKFFLDFSDNNSVIPLTRESVESSSHINLNLKKNNVLLNDIDVLIAGIALSNNLTLITTNTDQFQEVKYLRIEDWSL